MALSADTTHETRPGPLRSGAFTVKNAATIYGNALVGLGMPGHASAGYVFPYAPAAYVCPVGFAIGPEQLGDTSASPVPTTEVSIEEHERKLTITGLAGTVADVGKAVWASADGTFTLTEQSNGWVIGTIKESVSATQAWVAIHSWQQFLLQYRTEVAQVFSPTPTPTP